MFKTINYSILRKLRTTRKSSPTYNLKFPIDYRVFSFLIETFHFDSKFQENNEFISKYSLECERCENERYYCTATNFSFKINKGRKLKFNQRGDGTIHKRIIAATNTLSISFLVNKFP